MNVYQTITIQVLRIDGITNSSVLQIGTAGIVKSLSNLYNTGGFTAPAPSAVPIEDMTWVPFSPETE